jgi:metallophosphoesterase superfamily enzyme
MNMKSIHVIAIADDDSRVGRLSPDYDVDLLIGLGDLYDVTLEKAIDLYAPEHVLAIRGNHDVATPFPKPTIDLHCCVTERYGLRFGGFAGSWQYKRQGNHMYTQEQMHDLMADFPAVDVFIAHNSPRGIHERDAGIHQGFDAFLDYIDRIQPRYFLHGHQHCKTISYRGETCIMGVYGEKEINLAL